MQEPQVSPTSRTRPEQHWVSVVDEHGRARLESRWTVAPVPVAPTAPALTATVAA